MFIIRRVSLCLILSIMAMDAWADKPHVVVLTTGGTIAGAGESATEARYAAAKLSAQEVLAAVPQVQQLADVTAEQVLQIASQAITIDDWLTLARAVNRTVQDDNVTGVVITHGTDTLEETAYFLNLVINTNKPIVLVAAMRPPTSLSPDGAMNLYNAVAVAASPKAVGKGVLVVMNDTIHSARYVTKHHTLAVDAFFSPEGWLGRAHYGEVHFYRQPLRRHTADSQFNIEDIEQLPQTDILYGYVSPSAAPIPALIKAGSKGIVYAGVGNGNLYPAVEQALAKASKEGVIIVRSSRVGEGIVLHNHEVDDDQLGFITADELNPPKARLLLMLALTQTDDKQQIQQWFYQY